MTDASTRGRRNRANGASNERRVADMLFRELGIRFQRNLKQTQEAGHGDLVANDCDFPFSLEVKRTTASGACLSAWEVQAQESAKKDGKHACVVYSRGSQPWRFRIYFDAFAEATGGRAVSNQHADLDIQGFAYVCREIMAWNA